jgi:hypothetical protein
MKAPSSNQRLYWCFGGSLTGFGGLRLTQAQAESLRSWYLATSLDFGVASVPGQYCIRAARELREALTEAGRWVRASGCVSDIGRRAAA